MRKIKRAGIKNGITDKELVRFINKDNPVILDIGCNDGTDTLRFLKLFRNARVYCFEPDPRARKRYGKQVADSRVKLFSCAISDKDGITNFYMSEGARSAESREKYPEGWDLSGSIRKPKRHLELYRWCEFNKVIRIQTKKLDTWCMEEGIDSIDFIWADIQGAEVDLIRGGKTALRRTRFLYTEYSNLELYTGQITLAEMLKLSPNFKLVRKYPNDALLKNKLL